jgi:hypothetical protein
VTPNGELTFRFSTDVTERASALKESLLHGPTSRFTRTLGGLAAVIAASAFLFSVAKGVGVWTAVGGAFPYAVLSVLSLGTFSLIPLREYARYVRRNTGPQSTAEIRSFSETGVFTSTTQGSEHVPWSSVREVVETESFIFLYPVSGRAMFLPKHVLDADEEAALRELLAGTFTARLDRLRLH